MTADVVIIGGGLIGLSIARGLAAENIRVTLISRSTAGEASPAAAGMLAPSVERTSGPAHAFAVASRDRFPRYLDALAEETGVAVPLNRKGVLQVAITANGVKGLKKSVLPGAEWIDATQLHEIEPSLGHGLGAVFSPNDGCVDNTALLSALLSSIASSSVMVIERGAVAVNLDNSAPEVVLSSGDRISAAKVVVAAGAWVSLVQGATFGKHVRPVRGQMLAFDSPPLQHVVYGPRGYLVPRAVGHTLAGSTMEDAGFDSATTADGIARVHSAAAEIFPALLHLKPTRAWAGLRPVTPDLLPLIGPDPAEPRVLYACGHSRNGVLLAPVTAEVVTDLIVGRGVAFDLTQFRPDRFTY